MRVFIWGMGLIGASLGLRLKEQKIKVSGAVRSEKSRKQLEQMGLSATTSPEECLAALADTDVLALGLNIQDCYPVLDQVMAIADLRKRLIIFDMCSSKQQICEYVQTRYGDAAFVGCHPMAGKEKQGPEAADALLFEGSTVFIVPPDSNATMRQKEGLTIVERIWQLTGAKIAKIGAEQHDNIMAHTSHGLHLAACLIARLSGNVDIENLATSPAGGSYRDMTRIVESSGVMWSEIIESNRVHTAAWLRALAKEAGALAATIENGNADIAALFVEASAIRSRIMRK